jgi:hypothetical protein
MKNQFLTLWHQTSVLAGMPGNAEDAKHHIKPPPTLRLYYYITLLNSYCHCKTRLYSDSKHLKLH